MPRDFEVAEIREKADNCFIRAIAAALKHDGIKVSPEMIAAHFRRVLLFYRMKNGLMQGCLPFLAALAAGEKAFGEVYKDIWVRLDPQDNLWHAKSWWELTIQEIEKEGYIPLILLDRSRLTPADLIGAEGDSQEAASATKKPKNGAIDNQSVEKGFEPQEEEFDQLAVFMSLVEDNRLQQVEEWLDRKSVV